MNVSVVQPELGIGPVRAGDWTAEGRGGAAKKLNGSAWSVRCHGDGRAGPRAPASRGGSGGARDRARLG